MKGRRGEIALDWEDLRGHFEGRDLDDVHGDELHTIAAAHFIVERPIGITNFCLIDYLGRNDEGEVIFITEDME